MKLINKVLTVVAPVAMVGVITPAIASCSCSPAAITINYGDDINCRDKDDKDHPYHNVDEVKTAIVTKAEKHDRGSISDAELEQYNNRWSSDPVYRQEVYYDLIASKVITGADTILLIDWKVGDGSGAGTYLSFTLNNQQHTGTTDRSHLIYEWNSDKLWLYYDIEPICTSYRFNDCTRG